MRLVDGKYEFDFEDLSEKAKRQSFSFCNPQNPTSRALSREELEKYGRFAQRTIL